MTLRRIFVLWVPVLTCLSVFADDLPVGFEDPALLDQVMSGKIVYTDIINTNIEYTTIVKAFFNKVSPEAFVALATNHANYPQLFPEFKKGETVKVNADHSVFDYKFDLAFLVGPFPQHFYPEGTQTFHAGANATDESVLDNTLTNYTDSIKESSQHTRLIPFKSGMLVEDNHHAAMLTETTQSKLVKTKLKDYATRCLPTFRKALQGNY